MEYRRSLGFCERLDKDIFFEKIFIDKTLNKYLYRDAEQNEVDFLIGTFEDIIPIEVKLSVNPNKRDIEKFKVLNKLDKLILNGGIICLIDRVIPVNDKICFIPVGLI